MWNWIKYLPLDWRDQDINCIPSGPRVNSGTPQVTIPIAGSLLRFQAPRHRPRRKEQLQHRLLPGSDALSHGISRNYGNGVMANECWGGVTPFSRAWAFWGPWMTGAKAQLDMAISIYGRHDQYAFPNTSFFNPKAFETVIMHYLNDRYGHSCWENGTPRFEGPAAWKACDHLPVFSAKCSIYKLDSDGKTPFHPERLWLFPITSTHFVEVCFSTDIYSFDPSGKPLFDISPVNKLERCIIDSMALELSSEAQADYRRATEEAGSASLTEYFPPLQWPTTGGPSVQDETPQLRQDMS